MVEGGGSMMRVRLMWVSGLVVVDRLVEGTRDTVLVGEIMGVCYGTIQGMKVLLEVREEVVVQVPVPVGLNRRKSYESEVGRLSDEGREVFPERCAG
jgi:hypothetical protein